MDDRIGCAVLVRIAQLLEQTPCRDDVYFVFSVQEEVGLRGSRTAAFGIQPDIGLVYDVTGTGDSLGAKPMACTVGGGAAIKLKDSSVICNRALAEELAGVAKENGIKYQFEILAAGGTDTASIQVSGAGVRVGALSIPTRYIHTGTEVLDLNDAEACAALTVAWLRGEEKGAGDGLDPVEEDEAEVE
jgi:endoglucanase